MRSIRCDGSPDAVATLRTALSAALRGGEAVLPLPADSDLDWPDAPGDTAVVIATSGSTGQPKGVALPATALRASATASQTRLGGPGQWLLAIPPYHIAGLQVLVRSELAGIEPAVMDLRAGFHPDAFAATAARATRDEPRYVSLVPTQLARLLDERPDALAGFTVLLGGAHASPPLLDQAARHRIPVVRSYGMTETAGGCVYDGCPLDGVRLRLGPADRIELTGPVLATGYLGERQPAEFHDGWFRTSDVGRIEDGRLRVLGRLDDVIITGGMNVAPANVEAELVAQPGVATACVVGIPDPDWGQRVIAAVVPDDPAHPPSPGALRDAVRRRLTPAEVPKDVVLLDALPLLGIGKPDRRALAAALSATVSQTHDAVPQRGHNAPQTHDAVPHRGY